MSQHVAGDRYRRVHHILVFEQHIPERVRLPQHSIRIGSQVVVRGDDDSPTWEVMAIGDGSARRSMTSQR